MKKHIIFFLSGILILAGITYFYFYSIWNEYDSSMKAISKKAYKEISVLYDIQEINLFTGTPYHYILRGKDHVGKPLMIWMNDNESHYKYLSKWVSKNEISEKVKQSMPNASIKRIVLGVEKKGDEVLLIYEVLLKDNQSNRLGYQYFNIENGNLIKMYRLGKTAS